MKSVTISSYGSPDVIKIIEIDSPDCSSNQVKIKLESSSINHLDLWVRSGGTPYSHTFPFTLGSDASGTIIDKGKDVKDLSIGQDVVIFPANIDLIDFSKTITNEHYMPEYRILGEHINGVQSENLVISSKNVFPIPDKLNFIDASTFPLVFMTAYEMLVEKAKIKEGDKVLIIGANSGIGSAAVQIAKQFKSIVYSTVSSKEKFNYAEYLGSDFVYCHNNNFHTSISKDVGKDKFDIIIEHIGEHTWDSSIRLLGIGGRLIFCGSTTGYNVNINLKHMFVKQQSIIGSSMSSLSTFKKVIKMIESFNFKSINDKTFSFSEAVIAHKYIESRKNIGKITLVP